MSKFSNIVCPFYGRFRRPPIITLGTNGAIAKLDIKSKREYIIWHKDYLGSTYLDTLIKMDAGDILRLPFQVTCLNLGQVINSSVKWGVDTTGQIHDLSYKEEFLTKTFKVTSLRHSFITVKGISYPLEINIAQFPEDLDFDNLWIKVVYIDNTWYPHSVVYYPERESYVSI